MSKLSVSLACCAYDRTRAIFEGLVPIEGCEVNCFPMSPEEAFHRAFNFQEFDITELSMSSFMCQQARAGSPYIGIPVFASRMFRHSSIYINADRGIAKPEDLIGKTIGVPEYQMTAALWVRGTLQDDYGVTPSDINWRVGGLEQAGRKQVVSFDLPEAIKIEAIPSDETLSQQLNDGNLDALITARAPSCFDINERIIRLFPDYRAAEEAYYIKNRMFPIMHIIGIRRSLVEQHPWLPVNVFNAFNNAKQICYDNLAKVGHLFTTLPWPVHEYDAARQLMGDDYWPYGVQENAREISAMTRYAYEQGLTPRLLTAEDLFARSTFHLMKV